MEVNSNKAIVERYFEMWNTGNIDLADKILASDYIDYAHPEIKDPDMVKQSIQTIRANDPTFHIEPEFIIGEGDLVALRGKIERTHKEQPIVSYVLWFVRVIDGKMTALWTGVETVR